MTELVISRVALAILWKNNIEMAGMVVMRPAWEGGGVERRLDVRVVHEIPLQHTSLRHVYNIRTLTLPILSRPFSLGNPQLLGGR
ncbi:hypothetical protein E2C01_052834 [Portunus trituberculatus]|uniref:Uncharacterized protein n=1 Tax=Portunus trituberculatus TaxID=210409 RepID=A0A5B7GQE7_PORTR|nr:hypothetical protein [Portunus trituberculatus]